MGRRELTSTVTMLALVGILVLGAVVGWNSLFADVDDDPTSAPSASSSCTATKVGPGERVRSRQVRVSVYNAGTESGLADETIDALLRRGFIEGSVGNAPSDIDVRRVEVWSTVEGDVRAELVARQFGKKTKIRFADEELGPGVDVIVGDGFRGLSQAKRFLKVKAGQEVCLPEEPADTNA